MTDDLARLQSVDGPWVHTLTGERESAERVVQSLDERYRCIARVLRGDEMLDSQALFARFSAAFEFPWYFGKNWDAFTDCIGDLEWFPIKDFVTVMVTDAHLVLSKEIDEHYKAFDPSTRHVFLDTMNDIGKWWSVSTDSMAGRPVAPFHTVLQVKRRHRGAIGKLLNEANVDSSEIQLDPYSWCP